MIRIRVYPQRNSIGARRMRHVRARQHHLHQMRAWHRQQMRMQSYGALQGAWGGAYAPSFASPFSSQFGGSRWGMNASPWGNSWGSTGAYMGGLGACAPASSYGGYGGWGSNLGMGSGGMFSNFSSFFS